MIFNIVIDNFFKRFPDRREVRYTAQKTGDPRESFIRDEGEVGLAGLSYSYLLPLETALIFDTTPLRELVAIRLEKPTLTLIPGYVYNEGKIEDSVSWPSISAIPKPLQDLVRVVAYNVV